MDVETFKHFTDLEVWRLRLINNEAHEDVKLLIVQERISVKSRRNQRRETETCLTGQNVERVSERTTDLVTSSALWTLAWTEPRRSAPIFFKSCVSRTNNQSWRSSLWTEMKSTSVSRNMLNTWNQARRFANASRKNHICLNILRENSLSDETVQARTRTADSSASQERNITDEDFLISWLFLLF